MEAFPSAPCRFFFFRRVFAAMSAAVEAAGGGGGHVIYLSPFPLRSRFSTSHLLPHLVAPSWQLPLSFSPLLLSLPFSVRHSPLTLSCSVPVCLLFLPQTPNVEQLYLSRSVARYSSAFSLFLSFSASILFAPSPRPASQAPCFSSRGKNRFPRVLSCVPGIVGNYSTQPAIPFSPFSLAVPMYVCLRFRLFCVARFQRRRRCP